MEGRGFGFWDVSAVIEVVHHNVLLVRKAWTGCIGSRIRGILVQVVRI